MVNIIKEEPSLEKSFKEFSLFNKKGIEKTTKHLNNEMEEADEEFYDDKKKTMTLSYKLSSLFIITYV